MPDWMYQLNVQWLDWWHEHPVIFWLSVVIALCTPISIILIVSRR
jgi:hypothetical protein